MKFSHAKKLSASGKLLIFGLAVLASTVAVASTASYAWFILADNLVASNISVNLQTNAFKIGFKTGEDYTYYSQVSSTELAQYDGFDPNAYLLPVSGMYESLWNNASTDPKTALPQFRSAYWNDSDPRKSSLATSGYLQFAFYLYSNDDIYVYLDTGTSLTANTAVNAATAAKYSISADDLNKVADCCRVSFYSENGGYHIFEPNVDKSSNTAYAGRLNIDNTDDYYDYDSNGYEILYGDYNYQDFDNKTYSLVYDKEAHVDTLVGTTTAFNAMSAPKAQALDVAKSIDAGLKINHETSYSFKDLEVPSGGTFDASKPYLVKLTAEKPERIVVSVYAEGWDLDMIDSINMASFNLSLAFRGQVYGGA